MFSYALQPAKRTSASFVGAILEEYLVKCNTLSHRVPTYVVSLQMNRLNRTVFHQTLQASAFMVMFMVL